jgi:hypothetical protein
MCTFCMFARRRCDLNDSYKDYCLYHVTMILNAYQSYSWVNSKWVPCSVKRVFIVEHRTSIDLIKPDVTGLSESSITQYFMSVLYDIHIFRRWNNIVDTATGYGLDNRGVGVRVPVGARIFSKSSRLALGSTQPPIQWVPGTLSPGVKRQGREADQSPPTSAEVKKIYPLPHTPSWRSA